MFELSVRKARANTGDCAGRIEIGAQPFHLRRTLLPLQHGAYDPTCRIGEGEAWRASRTPAGPALGHYRHVRGSIDGAIEINAWGPGAEWLVSQSPELLGLTTQTPILPDPPRWLADAQNRHQTIGTRQCRSTRVFEAAVPSVIEQRVTSLEAVRSYRNLTKSLSDPAPGPHHLQMWLPVSPTVLAATPPWSMHRFGIEHKRAQILRRIAQHATALERASEMQAGDAFAHLLRIPGVGPWTAAEVARPALGDTDAVSVGDFHLKNIVCWNLAAKSRGSDNEMVELLAPFRPHRAWAVRLILEAGSFPPKFGPRYNPLPIAQM